MANGGQDPIGHFLVEELFDQSCCLWHCHANPNALPFSVPYFLVAKRPRVTFELPYSILEELNVS